MKLFIHIKNVLDHRRTEASRRVYKRHPTHTPNSAGEALQELARGIRALDRHLARRRAEDQRSITRRLGAWLAGVRKL